jgi:hypothetical protein
MMLTLLNHAVVACLWCVKQAHLEEEDQAAATQDSPAGYH